jgi:hypothetical protein
MSSLRIEALTDRMDLLTEQADLTTAVRDARRERDAQVNYHNAASPTKPKFQARYKEMCTPLPDGSFPSAAFYIRKPGRKSVKELSDIAPIAQAAVIKQRECQAKITTLNDDIKYNTKRLAEIAGLLASPPEVLTSADLALSADELQALLRTEAPDTDARYDDSPSARLANAEATEAEATAKRLQADADAYATEAAGKATANAIRERGAALRDNPQLVDLVQAEKWNGVLPTTMVPGSAVPFINVK